MASFYKYETVEIPLKFTPEGVLNGYKHIMVSIVQNGIVQVDKSEEELNIDTEEDTITVLLSQEETGMFMGGDLQEPITAQIQVNIYYENAERDVSTIGEIDVYNNLYSKVMEDE